MPDPVLTPQRAIRQVKVVHQAAEAKAIMVEYTDGYGETQTRLGFVCPGGDIRFLNDNSVSRPASSWLSKAVMKKLGAGDGNA